MNIQTTDKAPKTHFAKFKLCSDSALLENARLLFLSESFYDAFSIVKSIFDQSEFSDEMLLDFLKGKLNYTTENGFFPANDDDEYLLEATDILSNYDFNILFNDTYFKLCGSLDLNQGNEGVVLNENFSDFFSTSLHKVLNSEFTLTMHLGNYISKVISDLACNVNLLDRVDGFVFIKNKIYFFSSFETLNTCFIEGISTLYENEKSCIIAFEKYQNSL